MNEAQKEAREKPARKSEETRRRILEAALATFRERGFDSATMREVAATAGMAVGAAYYYFPSKDAIVLAFYAAAQAETQPLLEDVLHRSKTLEASLRGIIETKLTYFADNRALLAALAGHVNPRAPLSPFSDETAEIRARDLHFFEEAVTKAKVKLPKQVAPYLPRLLWMYQMGILLFWVYDESNEQRRTAILLDKTARMLAITLRLASLPLLRPLHRLAGELLDAIYGNEHGSG